MQDDFSFFFSIFFLSSFFLDMNNYCQITVIWGQQILTDNLQKNFKVTMNPPAQCLIYS